MSDIERCWLALSPGEPATTDIIGDESALADYRAQNWIIQGPFVLEATYREAVEENRQLRGKLAAIRCEIDARRDCADMQAVRYYADEATTVSLGRGQ